MDQVLASAIAAKRRIANAIAIRSKESSGAATLESVIEGEEAGLEIDRNEEQGAAASLTIASGALAFFGTLA